MGGDPCGLPWRSLLQRLPGGISTRHPAGAAHCRGQRVGADGARRAVEQQAAPKARALRQEEPLVLEVRRDARVVSATLPARLQQVTGSLLRLSHYQRRNNALLDIKSQELY